MNTALSAFRARFRPAFRPLTKLSLLLLAASPLAFHPSVAAAQYQQWVWMGGSKTLPATGGLPGVYGTLHKPAAANHPGSRQGAATWTDPSGNFWLFGGYGYDSAATPGYLNDLWEYNPTANQWTWMGGSKTLTCVTTNNTKTCSTIGSYGAPGAATNIPGGREDASSWTDPEGNFWLFSGNGSTTKAGTVSYISDLWESATFGNSTPPSSPGPPKGGRTPPSPAHLTKPPTSTPALLPASTECWERQPPQTSPVPGWTPTVG